MYRRTLLVSLIALAATQAACQQQTDQPLRIAVLKGTVPPQLVSAFKETLQDPVKLSVQAKPSMAELFHQLQQWQTADNPTRRQLPFNLFGSRPARMADWVSLSDYWLAPAIQQQLISPLPVDSIPQWSELPEQWPSLLYRDRQGRLSDQGLLWATPYRWGYLAMVYSRRSFERLGWQPTEWQDIWHPDLAGRVSLLNHPRITLGMVLKSHGYSANDAAPATHSDFKEALKELPQQIVTYASENYVQPLIQGRTWLAVGWSTDIMPLLSRYRQLDMVIPAPGTLLSADLWVKPSQASLNDQNTLSEDEKIAPPKASFKAESLDSRWLAHWWQSDTEAPLSLFSNGLSPRLLMTEDSSAPTTDLSTSRLLRPSTAQLEQSEFLTPLSEESVEEYTRLWEELRRRE